MVIVSQGGTMTPVKSAAVIIICAMTTFARMDQAFASNDGPLDRSRGEASQASSGRTVEENAIGSIPFEKLDADSRAKISALLSGSHIFRRMPIHVGLCDPDLYLFLVRHPDVVVGIWEELGVSKLRMRQIGSGKYQTQETGGTTGTSQFIYQDPNLHLIWVEGVFSGPLLSKPVYGSSLLILRTGYVRDSDGKCYITSRLDTFTHIENVGIEFVTKTLQPLMGKVVDNNFLQTSAFVAGLSKTAETNPRGVRRLAGKLDKVQPEVRQQFALLAYKAAEKAGRNGEDRLAAKKPVGDGAVE